MINLATKDIPDVLASVPVDKSVMLCGSPGVGISAAIRKFAEQSNLTLHTILLSQVDLIDLMGLTVVNPDGTVKRLPPSGLSPAPNSVLFLDDFDVVSPLVQSLAYQIAFDRAIGDQDLPPDCRVIVAGGHEGYPIASPTSRDLLCFAVSDTELR